MPKVEVFEIDGAVLRVSINRMENGRQLVWLEICDKDGMPLISVNRAILEGEVAEFDVDTMKVAVTMFD